MSKKNYNKISTERAKVVDEVIEEVVEEVIEEVEVPEVQEPECFEAKVIGCSKLNVRANPKADAKVECVIPSEAIVVVFPDKSTDEWYNVVTEAGIEGYCMKKFISIKE